MQRILSTFAEIHDDVKVTLRHEMRRGTLLGLEDDTTDLAIFLGPREIGPDYTVVTLFEDPVMAVVRSTHELARGPAVDIRDVVRFPFSSFPNYAESGPERALRAFWLAIEHRGDAAAMIAHRRCRPTIGSNRSDSAMASRSPPEASPATTPSRDSRSCR